MTVSQRLELLVRAPAQHDQQTKAIRNLVHEGMRIVVLVEFASCGQRRNQSAHESTRVTGSGR